MNLTEQKKDELFTSDYLFTFASNFLMFFAFYMLLPILPMYLADQFGAGKSLIGAILASYTITALIVRPFAGFLVDRFQRKPLFLLAYTLFIGYFAGYIVAGTIMVFAVLRATHGLAFGLVTISSSTVAVDIMPASRRNEGIGYFGLSMNIAMAIGPMTALYLFDTTGNYDYIFGGALLSGIIGLCCIFFIHTPYKERIQHEAISFDRFFLVKGLPGAINLALLSFSYGILSTYVAVYGSEEVGLESGTGLFFVAMAGGLVISRVISGRMMNRGELNKVINTGIIIMFLSYIVFIFLKTATGFFLSALFLGFAYGFVCPAFQAMFINLAHHNQRGTANSTYFIAWDLGIGTGVLLGGQIAEISSYTSAYICGLILVASGYLLFRYVTAKHYIKNKLY